MFLGREKELTELEGLYQSGGFQMVIVYGRRRVGKTTLISRFVQDKRTICFTAIESDSGRNLELFSREAMRERGVSAGLSFTGWNQAFDYAAERARGGRLVLVIDEFPYLAQTERSISSLLQSYCDGIFKSLPLMLILCGSSMSFMENQVLGYQSPLYGRRTAQMKIAPFDYREAANFVPRYSLADKALVYGITGGIPKYLELFNSSIPLKENIIRNFLSTSGYLYEEPLNLLKQELREPVKYNRIIEAVAAGASHLNDIASKSGLDTAAASNYINALISLGIIQKESAITEEKNRRKTIYRLVDTMFMFWYRYVQGSDFAIISGGSGSLYETTIKPDLSRFMGFIFERMCAGYLAHLNALEDSMLPFKILALGRWWGSNPSTKMEEEVDIVAVNPQLKSALFCECKYQNHAIDRRILQDLIRKSETWRQYDKKYYMLFSKQNFTKELRAAAKERSDVFLVTLADMYR